MIYIWKDDVTWEKERKGMGVVMEKLPHPYKLTHKITKKMEEAFRGGFPRERERGERNFFQNF